MTITVQVCKGEGRVSYADLKQQAKPVKEVWLGRRTIIDSYFDHLPPKGVKMLIAQVPVGATSQS